jgi:hypothetical protein
MLSKDYDANNEKPQNRIAGGSFRGEGCLRNRTCRNSTWPDDRRDSETQRSAWSQVAQERKIAEVSKSTPKQLMIDLSEGNLSQAYRQSLSPAFENVHV